MNFNQRATENIKYFIRQARGGKDIDPKKISKMIQISCFKEKNNLQEEERINQYIQSREIKNLVHFTHVDNLEMILTYGLMSKTILMNEGLRRHIQPKFLDNKYLEGKEDANYLSISCPDYESFYEFFKHDEENWAVILFNTEPIKKHKCRYKPEELAKEVSGFQGLKEMFSDSEIKVSDQIATWLTTNPRAKVIEESVIPPSWIKEVHLATAKHLKKVKKWSSPQNVQVKIEQKFFEPRIGHKYWPSSKFEPRIDHSYWPPQELNKVHVEGIHGDAHWDAFISAIEDSKNTLFILSGWITSYVIEGQVLSKMEDAIKRGVKIYLGYGYSKQFETHQIKPETAEALRRLKNLEQRTANEKGELCVKKFKNHAKVIIVDNKYRIVGSNNWLNNRTYSNSEYSIKVYSKIETSEAQKDLAADF